MSDNTKNGIIDLTEIVEMGTPPAESEKTIPASSAGTVDFESELEDLFSTSDFSEFADSSDESPQSTDSPVDLFTDTPVDEAPVSAPPASAPEVEPQSSDAPSFESDLSELLESSDETSASGGFDADFEDLLNDFSESPAQKTAPKHQPDFDEDLSAMSTSSEPEPVVVAEPAPQPQAVATEPAPATESNVADVTSDDVDDLFADLDFEMEEAPAASSAPEKPAPEAAPASDVDDLFADLDFDLGEAPAAPEAPASTASAVEAPVEDDAFSDFDFEVDPLDAEPATESAPQATPESSRGPSDDDLFADLGLAFDADDEVAPEAAPTPPSAPSKPQAAAPASAEDASVADPEISDLDDLFADIDLDDALAAPAPEPKPAAPAPEAPASPSAEDILADLDASIDTGEEPAAEAAPTPQAAPSKPQATAPASTEDASVADPEISDLDDLFADIDLDDALAAPAPEPKPAAPAPEAPASPSAEDILADLDASIDIGEEPVAEAAPTPPPAPSKPQSAVPGSAADASVADPEVADLDDLFADIDLDDALVSSEPEPVAAPEPQVATPAAPMDLSIDDPFDVDNILSETSDDTPFVSETDDASGLLDLDELLRVDDDSAQAPRGNVSPADGITLESEEVEMDDIGSLLSEFDSEEAPFAAPEQTVEPASSAEAADEFVAEPLATSEVRQPSAPVDPSMFDDDIDALLDDLEMASAEPTAPLSEQPEAPVASEEPESAVSAEAPEDEVDLDSLMERDQLDVEGSEQEPVSESPVESAPDTTEKLDSDDIVGELEALLDEVPDEVESIAEETEPVEEALAEITPEEAPAMEAPAVDDAGSEEVASPLGSADEFESILDELDSLLEEQDAAADAAVEENSAEPADALFDVPVEDVLDEESVLEEGSEELVGTESEISESAAFEPEVSLQDVEPEELIESEAPEQDLMPEPEAEVLAEPTSLEEDLDSTLDRILGEDPLSTEAPQEELEEDTPPAAPVDFTHDDIDELLSEAVEEPQALEEPALEDIGANDAEEQDGSALFAEAEEDADEEFAEAIPETQIVDEPVLDAVSEILAAEEELSEPSELDDFNTEDIDTEDFASELPELDDMAVESDVPEEALDAEDIAEHELASETGAEVASEAETEVLEDTPSLEEAFDEPDPVVETMDAMEEDPMADIEQEAMAELESLAEVQPEDDASEDALSAITEDDSASAFDMEDIDEHASPIPPNASIGDLMRESTVVPPEFSDSSLEMLDTTPAVSSAIVNEEPYDVPPTPVMTPEEFAELTERIYHLESTLQNVVAAQEAQAHAEPQPPVVEKETVVSAIDEAFDMDGPIMARVLSAVEVRTETLIESMGTRIEGQVKGAIEQAAAKSAAQVIREELKALLSEEPSE
ncbi:hypothetical protein [Halodesulfovibrio sp.]|jgi:hypothetical protein|uniref:hypothetical protein n=1 Tax=Halodesulfovibrio sp. TaxID=1912772 RepID=UPI0025FB79E1|nr:hypothetical protein [Halodesulfovibrio sp.]MCT4627597.1 hypothetical protein [Halodesulfovibrio sp.]